jgi:hypothetical protein
LKNILYILFCLSIFLFQSQSLQAQKETSIDFYDGQLRFVASTDRLPYNGSFSQTAFESFVQQLNKTGYESVISSLKDYKSNYKLDDWLYYQLIRKTAQFFSPKADDYIRYTIYKWFFLTRSGYDALLTVSNNKVLFYVKSNESIYNIPYRMKNGNQYVCLNYHDYGSIDFEKERFTELILPANNASQAFSYKVTQLPGFDNKTYKERDIQFTYNETEYSFRIKINEEVKTIFKNYPAVDYEAHFNMPISTQTYNSLIPILKKQLKGVKPKNGVEFLMHFTRYAFLYKPDIEVFGQEKRLSPEQTLLSEYSDCEDRAALFFFLVKELYNLPMVVLAYPKHVSIAVQFDKPVGETISYKGGRYSICDPTPQKKDLSVGQVLPELKNTSYEIVYSYSPHK